MRACPSKRPRADARRAAAARIDGCGARLAPAPGPLEGPQIRELVVVVVVPAVVGSGALQPK